MHVTLRDLSGVPLGDAGQTAILTPTLSGNAWSLNYAVGKAQPDGCYVVEVKAHDQVARTLAADSDQLASHTTIVTGWIVLQTSAPKVALDWQPALASGQLGPAVTALSGEATHRPVPVPDWLSVPVREFEGEALAG